MKTLKYIKPSLNVNQDVCYCSVFDLQYLNPVKYFWYTYLSNLDFCQMQTVFSQWFGASFQPLTLRLTSSCLGINQWKDFSTCNTFSRDLDSKFTDREAAAVSEWLESGKPIHSMRDNPQHNVPLLGACWGTSLMKDDIQDIWRSTWEHFLNDSLNYSICYEWAVTSYIIGGHKLTRQINPFDK